MFIKPHIYNIIVCIAVLIGIHPPRTYAKEPTKFIVMLKSHVTHTNQEALSSSELTTLSNIAGVTFSSEGVTRTQGQILSTVEQIDDARASEIITALNQAPQILWANQLDPPKAVSSRLLNKPSAQASCQYINIKLRNFGVSGFKPSNALIQKLSTTAGIPLTPVRRTASGAWVFSFDRSLSLENAQSIEQRLEFDPEVQYADPVRIRQHQSTTPNDPYFGAQWHLFPATLVPGSANIQPAWDVTTGITNVTVAILDTGILWNPTHPDLAARLTYLNPSKSQIAGWDLISTIWSARDGNKRDAKSIDQGDWVTQSVINQHGQDCAPVSDSSWHGSHVAGIIGATTNNGLGISGINWRSRLLPVRVMGACGGYDSDIIDGIYWAAGGDRKVTGAPANPFPAQVINLSLGGDGACPDSYQEAINYALAHNASITIAAGNTHSDAVNSAPGNCQGVISVAAVGPSGNLASYSDYGSMITISAPGGDSGADSQSYTNGILSTINVGRTVALKDGMSYDWYEGTSMAAPVVAGVISLMLSVDDHHRLTSPQKVKDILARTARDFPSSSICGQGGGLKGRCGAGIVDANAAVLAVKALQ